MRYYAHWLDGEYVRLSRIEADARRSQPPGSEANQAMKLHALFGNQIVLNDIHLIDSPVLQALFADDAFLSYVRDQGRTFLEIVAASGASRPISRYVVATSGLRRATVPGWTSSSLPTPQPIVELAQVILAEQDTDPESVLQYRHHGPSLLQRWPQYRTQLKAIAAAVHHFASTANGAPWQASDRNPRSFYELLLELRGKQGPRPEDEERVEHTLQFIEAVMGPEHRGYRSRVRSALERNDWPRPEVVSQTVASAWSCAAEETIRMPGQTLGGSVGYLPSGALIPFYQSTPVDALFQLQGAREHRLFTLWRERVVAHMSWDPNQLDWTSIRRLAEDTRDSREALQRALAGNDDRIKRQAIVEHVRKLVSYPPLRYEPPDPVPQSLWLIGGAAGIAAGLVIGSPDLSKLWTAGMGLARAAYGTIQASVRLAGRFRVAHTLREAGGRILKSA